MVALGLRIGMSLGVAEAVLSKNSLLRTDPAKRQAWERNEVRAARDLPPAVVPASKPDWMDKYEEALGWPTQYDGSARECGELARLCSGGSAPNFHRLLPVPEAGPIVAPAFMTGMFTAPVSGWDPNNMPMERTAASKAAAAAAKNRATTVRTQSPYGPPAKAVPVTGPWGAPLGPLVVAPAGGSAPAASASDGGSAPAADTTAGGASTPLLAITVKS